MKHSCDHRLQTTWAQTNLKGIAEQKGHSSLSFRPHNLEGTQSYWCCNGLLPFCHRRKTCRMTSKNSPCGKNRYFRLTSATAQGRILTNDKLRKKSGKLIVGSWKQRLDGEIGQRLMHQWQGFEPQKESSKACALQNCFVLVILLENSLLRAPGLDEQRETWT